MMFNKGMLLDMQGMVNNLLDLHHEYEDQTSEINRLETSLLDGIVSSMCFYVEVRNTFIWDSSDSCFDLVVGYENACRRAKEFCGRVWGAVLDENGMMCVSDEMIHDENW